MRGASPKVFSRQSGLDYGANALIGVMMSSFVISLAVVAVGGYLLGSLPWAYLIGRGHGIDIRRHGSGNVGATNVSRVLGRNWGILCFGLDFLKGLVPVLAAQMLFAATAEWPKAGSEVLLIVAIIAPIAGHNWSVFLGFHGGKGVAVSTGALTALTPWAVLIAGAIWLLVFETSRYVSLASVLAAVVFPFAACGLSYAGISRQAPFTLGLLVVLSLLVVVRHRGNLRRLLAGTEAKFVRKGAADGAASATTTFSEERKR